MYPKVGSILRYMGSSSGLIYIFALPCLAHLKLLRLQGHDSRLQTIIHLFIIFIGVLNFVLQFFIKI